MMVLFDTLNDKYSIRETRHMSMNNGLIYGKE